jgi:DNA-binding CsgD family transcriptional regulator
LASKSLSDVDLAARVARLTAGQRECLDLVDDHATSKEIARQLGISRHTVDARLRGAIQTLGVSSRREAAIIYRAAMQAQGYQPFAYQPPRIVPQPLVSETMPQAQLDGDFGSEFGSSDIGEPDYEPERAHRPVHAAAPDARPAMGLVSDSAVWTEIPPGSFAQQRPFLRLWGGANDLNPTQRMLGILVVMIVAMLAFGLLLSGIEALTLLRS